MIRIESQPPAANFDMSRRQHESGVIAPMMLITIERRQPCAGGSPLRPSRDQ